MNKLQSIPFISSEAIRSYLARTGWHKEPYKKEHILKYIKPNSDIILLIPLNANASDYIDSLRVLISTLSQYECRDEPALIRNILRPKIDVIKFRFFGNYVPDSSLPLEYTEKAMSSIKEALIFAACSEIKNEAYFSRQLKEAQKIVKSSRVGKPEEGSFIIPVELPFDMPVNDQNKESTFEEPQIPIQRRIISRILKGVGKARAIAIDGEKINIDEHYKDYLNANLAESIAALQIKDVSLNVEISVDWDRNFRDSIPASTIPSVIIEQYTFEALKTIGNMLRGSIISRYANIIGKVLSLHSTDIDDENNNYIQIQTVKMEGIKSVRVFLSRDDYVIACNLHRDQKLVSVSGTIERDGKLWILTKYKDFKECSS